MALIPPRFMDCVVAIGFPSSNEPQARVEWVASGFLYGCRNEGKKYYRVYLVTNRHVLEGREKVHLRFNPLNNQAAHEYQWSLVDNADKPVWTSHPSEHIDVAVMRAQIKTLRLDQMQVSYFKDDADVAGTKSLTELGIVEGDSAFVLGFPMGLVGDNRNSVIVRSGTIARVRDVLHGSNHTMLVDALIFPGNSGGPVVLRPEPFAIPGTSAVTTPYLIGVVRSYVTFSDEAVSRRTGQTRVYFEENSGLAAVHTVDAIEETIRLHQQNRR